MKEFEIGSAVNSASLHPTKNTFVCGGDDFKMYKCDYETGNELGKCYSFLMSNKCRLGRFINQSFIGRAESFKGHFGSVHCVRFSPDGELYASGSEDGTLRLWQTTVGKTYGLWKCMLNDELIPSSANGDAAVKVDC